MPRAGIGNRTGQAYAFMAMTPIRPGEEKALERYLHGLRDNGGESPLARLPRTHMGRFVIVPDFHNDKTWKQRREEHLDLRYLIFTSNLDGDIETYLDELCDKLAPEAPAIWGRCVGCPENPGGQRLKHYLMHNQINTGVFFAAYQDASVARVKHCLYERERMIEFAVAAQCLAPEALQQAFLQEFGGEG